MNGISRTLACLVVLLALAGCASSSGSDAVDPANVGWKQFDADANGELSLEEFTQLRITQYAALDQNSDGKWTRREFVQRMPDMSLGRLDALRGKFKRWDKNEDGLWDTAEAAMAIEGNFKWLDKNKNGSVAVNEFPKQF